VNVSVDILLQSATGLKYLHENEIVHGDFKPVYCLVKGSLSNLIVKIADFDDIVDIKNRISPTKTITQNEKERIGITMAYIAPEIIVNNSKASKESDIYSWALSAFEVLGYVEGFPWKGVIPIL